jgi:hypothetical protein
MLLVYPMTDRFTKSLPVFTYSQQLRLWVVPFDLKKERLVYDTSLMPGVIDALPQSG